MDELARCIPSQSLSNGTSSNSTSDQQTIQNGFAIDHAAPLDGSCFDNVAAKRVSKEFQHSQILGSKARQWQERG
ncbi:unnamed protein product [Gongylonema pulchrum]|uniref:Uncharacterized protein n=1 Tax=Gongylonema pulchrum TaxID=637853 RepID=A0A183F0H1_9BILA|nr:unnamed protein product [Gongylonema pulchrum]